MTDLSAYESYKESDLSWISVIPSHWKSFRAKFLFNLEKRPPREVDGVVTAFRDGQVTLRSNRRTDGFTNSFKEIGYQGVREGDLVIHAMDAFAGAIGVSDSDGKSTPVYSCLTAKGDCHIPYYAAFLRSMAVSGYIESLAKGIRERSTDFRWGDISELVLPVPPATEQKSITKYLNRETARIDTLIAKKTRFIELLREKIVALASQSPDSQSLQWVRLSHICEVVTRPVVQQPGDRYTKLGVFNRGRGIFKRDETDTEDMGDSEFFWVQPGDLILSGQFAWEGAVALATEEHAECVVSHRFPIIRGDNNKVLTEYLFAYFLTSHGDFVLNDCSRGSAGRNRPLNMNLLLGWKIPVPPMQVQSEIARLVQLEKRIGEKVSKSVELLKEKRSALITAAVTGKIDVREAA